VTVRFDIIKILYVFALYSMTASALRPTETSTSNDAFNLCRIFLNHMGFMAWEKRSALLSLNYTMGHKKRAILFWTITPAYLDGFQHFMHQ